MDSAKLAQQFQQAVAFHGQGRLAEAERLYGDILRQTPRNAEVLRLLSIVAVQAGDPSRAIELATRAVDIDPRQPAAHITLGNALRAAGRAEDAVASYDRAIALQQTAEALSNRGAALSDLGRHVEAIAGHDRALVLKPRVAQIHYNRGNAYYGMGRYAEALADYDEAVTLNPSYMEAHDNHGNALRALGRPAEAILSYQKAIALAPENAQAHLNAALCQLQLGRFAEGWRGFEWRWRSHLMASEQRTFAAPRWTGAEDLAGKSILIYAEQGLGDTLQFCRYAPLVAAKGASVVLQVQATLYPVLTTLPGIARLLTMEEPVPPTDYCCPLLSLAQVFAADAGNIPAEPYLRSTTGRLDKWRPRLGAKAKPRIGIVWSGSRRPKNDRRPVGLVPMVEALSPRVQCVGLQKDVSAEDLDFLRMHPDILHFEDEIADFGDTAALIDLVDHVVSIDTSVAHLAGAMGKPASILLPFDADWRWLLARTDSPWYPSLRLYRQGVPNAWADVVARAAEDIFRSFFEGP